MDIEDDNSQCDLNTKLLVKKAHKQAHQAWNKNDVGLSRQAHDTLRVLREYSISSDAFPAPTPQHGSKYIKSVVFGGLDGIITTFAVVAAVAGGDLAAGVVIIMGISNLLADALAMGLGDYLSSKAQLDYIKEQFEKEKWETENYLHGEIEEMVMLYMSHGMSEEDARSMLRVMSKYRNVFVRTMMMEELELMPPSENDSPWKDGLVMFVSFCIFGALPLIAYAAVPLSNHLRLICASVVTAISLYALGAAKGIMTGQNRCMTGLMMCINGAAAAGVSYLIAWGINKAAGISGNCGG